MSDKTTILIKTETRRKLKQIGRKEQTYDDVISELMEKNESISKSSMRDPVPSSS
jgi:hypothetical protein